MKPFTVNTKSWHFKIVDQMVRPLPKTLCSYVRWLLFALSLLAFLLIGVFGLAFSLTKGCILWVMSFLHGVVFLLALSGYDAWCVTLAAVGVLVACIVLSKRAFDVLLERLPERFTPKSTRMERGMERIKESMIYRYLQAIHNKVCPIVEYREDDV